jgi:Ca2+/Na+ antiporter
MMLFGNVIGGIYVILFHIIVVTNIDNVLRPILVPREARLDSALMLLSVFAGITMFGAFGIVIGPVLMIVIVTTIGVYLAVYKGVPLEQQDEDDTEKSKKNKRRMGWLTRRAQKSDTDAPEPDRDAEQDSEADAAEADAAEPEEAAKPASP